MLLVNSLGLTQFRNYPARSFAFNERIVGICGANGTGKTNLLDAIHYLSITKSYFSRPDSQSVAHGMQGMRVDGKLSLNNEVYNIVCILRVTNRKEFSVNDEPYKKLSTHVGRFPCVMIAPDDVELITGSSEERRKFIDAILCQLDTVYLQQLIDYNRILQQRNSFLKQAAESNSVNETLLDIINEQLGTRGQFIHQQRKSFMNDFLPLVIDHYKKIAANDDGLQLVYESQLAGTEMKQLLKHTLTRDLALQRTSVGIHKAEVGLQMKNWPFKSLAST